MISFSSWLPFSELWWNSLEIRILGILAETSLFWRVFRDSFRGQIVRMLLMQYSMNTHVHTRALTNMHTHTGTISYMHTQEHTNSTARFCICHCCYYHYYCVLTLQNGTPQCWRKLSLARTLLHPTSHSAPQVKQLLCHTPPEENTYVCLCVWRGWVEWWVECDGRGWVESKIEREEKKCRSEREEAMEDRYDNV